METSSIIFLDSLCKDIKYVLNVMYQTRT